MGGTLNMESLKISNIDADDGSQFFFPIRIHAIFFQIWQVMVFDLDIIRISCIHGVDSPTVRFVRKLMVCPIGLGLIFVIWFLKSMSGRRMHFDTIFNLCGVFVFALFISITLTVVDPLQCGPNPDGSLSMVSNPGVICFETQEHIIMLILCIIGILCYPLAIIAWAIHTTCSYHARIASGGDGVCPSLERWRYI